MGSNSIRAKRGERIKPGWNAAEPQGKNKEDSTSPRSG